MNCRARLTGHRCPAVSATTGHIAPWTLQQGPQHQSCQHFGQIAASHPRDIRQCPRDVLGCHTGGPAGTQWAEPKDAVMPLNIPQYTGCPARTTHRTPNVDSTDAESLLGEGDRAHLCAADTRPVKRSERNKPPDRRAQFNFGHTYKKVLEASSSSFGLRIDDRRWL